MAAFPDIEVFLDDVVFKDELVEYHWTFTGTLRPGRVRPRARARCARGHVGEELRRIGVERLTKAMLRASH
jgi:hypothetical protein